MEGWKPEEKNRIAAKIGARLIRRRREAGWTIKQLAGECGLSPSFVSRLERGQTMPSIPSLQALAQALDVDLESFFAKDQERSYAISRKASRRKSYSLRGPKQQTIYQMELLADGVESPIMEPALVTIVTENKELETTTHGGQEFMYVVEGRIRITLGSRTYELEEGDAAYWDGALPHGAVNIGLCRARTLNVHMVPGRRTDTFQINKGFKPEKNGDG